MADHAEPMDVTAIGRGMGHDIFHGQGIIFQKYRIEHLWHQPVIGNNDQVAERRQRMTHPGIIGFRTAIPATTIEEDQHRQIFATVFRSIDVELLPGIVAKRYITRHSHRFRREGIEQAQGIAPGQKRCQTKRSEQGTFGHIRH